MTLSQEEKEFWDERSEEDSAFWRDQRQAEELFEEIVLALIRELRHQCDLSTTLYLNAYPEADCHGFSDIADCEIRERSFHEESAIFSPDGSTIAFSNEHEAKAKEAFLSKGNLIGDPFVVLDDLTQQFDLVLGNVPMGQERAEWIDLDREISLKAPKNWLTLYKSLCHISTNGYVLFLVEPAFGSSKWRAFLDQLAISGFHLVAVLNTPPNCMCQTMVVPSIAIFSRHKKEALLVADPQDSDSIKGIVQRMQTGTSSAGLEEGLTISPTEFRGFDNVRASMEIDSLSLQYATYRKVKLSEIAIDITLVEEDKDIEEKPNSIYIPTSIRSGVVTSLEGDERSGHHYIQVVLDSDVVSSKYAALFFSSELGHAIRRSLQTGLVVKKVMKEDVAQIEMPVPEQHEQDSIIQAHEELLALRGRIDDFVSELSLNPKSASEVLGHTEDMLAQLQMLSDADKIRSLVRKGETKICEFKTTLSLDVKKGTKEKYIEESALKTVVAFLNTEGGVLLIGVTDDGHIYGIEAEMAKLHQGSRDKFLLHLKNLMKSRIGEEYYPFIDYRTVSVDGAGVLMVACKESDAPSYLDRKDFYVRTNPATDRLEGPKLVEYVKRHFGAG